MDEATQARVKNWLKRSAEALRAAELEFNGEFYARTISTAYYAMFYAATAALFSIGITRSKHSGVSSAFGEHFVRSGKIAGEFGRMLRQTMDEREETEYSELPTVNYELAKQHLKGAHRFVEAITQYLVTQGLILE